MNQANKLVDINHYKSLKEELTRFMMCYKFGLSEINTKIDILKQEFQYINEYNPIEHVRSRLKTPESILKKAIRKKIDLSLTSFKQEIKDIAGIRITCSFLSDIYIISDMLNSQKDIKLIETKDYIKNPKENGYKSLHHIIEIPVFMSDRIEHVYVELQIRTIAMDFWASLEHKIFYKYNKDIPKRLTNELKEAAAAVAELDKKMENIHIEVGALKEQYNEKDDISHLYLNNEKLELPLMLVQAIMKNKTN
ncbi:GTP pyrophosphokinase [Desulfuribacillus alkaliarsenatis]|uniref:GTP pyrophosphokinase n=1 Tax=Desulfuribacillus alkaliarsenatis TaxID=766136 RepID=A0A1E5G019_9FIRM|nr:GTP pyrophosphokinase family protein [Desulfuribacillus alkaliarsenatis]OEF96176.1 GTP pyrophosphokinase [Desulfuribacillus alkaliarsenatis]